MKRDGLRTVLSYDGELEAPAGQGLRMPSLRGARRYLAPGERVVHICRRHPVVLVRPFMVWLAAVLFIGLVSFVLTSVDPIPVVDTVAQWTALAVTVYLGFKYLQWRQDLYVVTDQRVLLIAGILSIKVSSVSLARVSETSFARSLWGRLLGYGDLLLDAPGERLTLTTLRYLPKPEALYRLVTSLIRSQEQDQGPRRVYDPREENTGPLPPVVI